MKSLLLAIISSVLLLTACGDYSQQRQHHHKHTGVQAVHIREYRHRQADGSWMFYYIMMNQQNQYYYYLSATQVSNYSSIPFTPAGRSLPADVEEQVEASEQVGTEQTVEASIDTTDAQSDAITNEGGPDSSSSSDSSSSDSGSSSSE